MRWVQIGDVSIDADSVDAVHFDWCGACGWHYYLCATMRGGSKIRLGEITWPAELGEYSHDPAVVTRGYEYLQQRVAAVTEQLAAAAA